MPRGDAGVSIHEVMTRVVIDGWLADAQEVHTAVKFQRQFFKKKKLIIFLFFFII